MDARVSKVVDLKTPSSSEQHRNLWSNIGCLTEADQVKFVVGDLNDFDWAVSKVIEFDLLSKAREVLISPVHGAMDLEVLADKILSSGLALRLQVQLHKLIWNDAKGR